MALSGHTRRFAATAVSLAVAACACAAPATAYAAESIPQLKAAYTQALAGYQEAVGEQLENAEEIKQVESEIVQTKDAIERSQGELNETAVSLYKDTRYNTPLVDMLLDSSSFQDAVMRYDTYRKVEESCVERIVTLEDEKSELDEHLGHLEERKDEIENKVSDAKKAAEDARRALLDASHVDGADYFQKQGNNDNCGATAFIVSVNTILHENRYTDNVEVWESSSFGSDSTQALVAKGTRWLLENGLSDKIAMEYVPGDIHEVGELIDQLEKGRVVIMSSGPGSVWQRADGSETSANAFSGGHYAMFYRYADGIFYCNDSSVGRDKGAGVEYTENQMQQWLDGRGNHYAVAMYSR